MSGGWGDGRSSEGASGTGLRRVASTLKAAWNEPDQFDWITAFLRNRGLLSSARMILATVAATAGMVPLTVLLGQRHPTFALLVAQLTGIALTTVMALYWSRRWPTRRQSQAAVLTGLMCVALWSQAQPSAAMAASICMAGAIPGGYIAFLHSNKMLALNFSVALTINILTVLRIDRETDFVDAVGAFWLILFMNLSVPLAIRGASRAIRIFATRSTTDPLTGLLNRPAFTETLIARLGDRPKSDTHLVVLLFDLDDFKRVNDTYGHAAGDRLLAAVADALRQCVTGNQTVCRSGGEEFLIAYTQPSANPTPLATDLCEAIAALRPTVTASIGSTSASLHGANRPVTADFVDRLVDIADGAMYAAKRNGGNRAHHEPCHDDPLHAF